MWNVSDKICIKNQNTHFVCNNLFPPEGHAVCEIMWKNMLQPDRPQLTTLYSSCALHTA